MAEQITQTFNDLIGSELFTFKVGEEQKPFVVHANAVAATSDTFRAMIQGGLIESATRSAELQDVRPDDFVRFLEYAYRREYTVPKWVLDESAGSTGGACNAREVEVRASQASPVFASRAGGPFVGFANEEEPAGQAGCGDSSWPSSTPKTSKKKKMATQTTNYVTNLRSVFNNHHYLRTGAPNTDLVEQFKTKGNSAAEQNFTPVFLAHARLYTFADMRLIQPLKCLALHKLHATLLAFQLYDQRVGDVVELARYAYDNGPDRSEAGEVNDLRQLVVEYMACEEDKIGKHKAFHALLEEGGEFVTDFWGIVTKYRLVA